PVELQAHALFGAGALATELGEAADALRWYSESLALYRAIDQRSQVAQVLQYLGFQQRLLGHLEQAEATLAESLAGFQASENHYGTAWTLLGLGDTAWDRGASALAHTRFSQVLTLGETHQIGECGAWARVCLGRIAHSEGQYGPAL